MADICCKDCGRPMVVNVDSTTNHVYPAGETPEGTIDDIDYDTDLDHAARRPQPDDEPEICDECGAMIPPLAEGEEDTGVINVHHEKTCSCHPDNTV